MTEFEEMVLEDIRQWYEDNPDKVESPEHEDVIRAYWDEYLS